MLRKLAQQTAIYGISTILVRFLSYLLTPYYTRVFGQETYGIVTDVYALIPLALTLLTMGLESGYFRFATKAEEAGGDVKQSKQRLFATQAVDYLRPKQVMIYVIDRATPLKTLSKIPLEKMNEIAAPLREKGIDVIVSA